jgi:hypothetical protein
MVVEAAVAMAAVAMAALLEAGNQISVDLSLRTPQPWQPLRQLQSQT